MITESDIAELVSEVSLGQGHEDQERVVAAALRRLLMHKQRGVVLADEVGFGKTYEALAVISHLCSFGRRCRRPVRRVLVLCKSTLVRKWEEETSSVRAGRGFPRYLPEGHPAQDLFGYKVRCIDNRATARDLRNAGVRAQRIDGRHQMPPGMYIVNEKLLQKEKRNVSTLLRQIWNTSWDIVVVDEAHHYARGNKPILLFAPDGNIRNDNQSGLAFKWILALTATPFELTPSELVNLLALIRANREVLDTLELGIRNFVKALDRFFEYRDRSPEDPLRQNQVAILERLRDRDALDSGADERGLESLLRRYLIRNTKSQNERRYFLTERAGEGFNHVEFQKLDDDLQQRVRKSPLVPFEGEHTLFYLQLRDVIQEVTEQSKDGKSKRTFIPVDLRQGLSSYRQIVDSDLLKRDLDSARRLRAMVEHWNVAKKLHPKVAALTAVVGGIVASEICRLRENPAAWFSKVLIFNKLIRGTAPQLMEVLGALLQAEFDRYLEELLSARQFSRSDLKATVLRAVDERLKIADQELKDSSEYSAWRRVPREFLHDDFKGYHGRPILQVFRQSLRRRAVQPLALIDILRSCPVLDYPQISDWVEREIAGNVIQTVRDVISRYLSNASLIDAPQDTLIDHAERDLIIELEGSKSVDVVGRFDGENPRFRESHRRNFNRRHNPFVLLVGQVGEEGIDLQEQCRYVIHYDLEWNPARMEQREGRVDRMGWMGDRRDSSQFIDVRFLLLKGTYEERIFHTVMRRDQWFQILIGSKRKELGTLPGDVDQEVDQDKIDDRVACGILTEPEKTRIMLNLRPE